MVVAQVAVAQVAVAQVMNREKNSTVGASAIMQHTLWNKDKSCSLLMNESGKAIYNLVDGKNTFTLILNKLLSDEGYSTTNKDIEASLDDILQMTTIFFDLSRVLMQFWMTGHLYFKIPDDFEKEPDKECKKKELLSPYAYSVLRNISDSKGFDSQQRIKEEFCNKKDMSFQMTLHAIKSLIETDSIVPVHFDNV